MDVALEEPGPKDATQVPLHCLDYSICTLVTRWDEYSTMVDAFRAVGFDAGCEYLYLDNSRKNGQHAFEGYNTFLQAAKGRHIILCHQDILPTTDTREKLDATLTELYRVDPTWGCCGNAGVAENGDRFLRISDPYQANQKTGELPGRVMSLDENFIVARKDKNLALSHDLVGFHWYGSDLCTMADILGCSSYVVDFHVYHKSKGHTDTGYHNMARLVRAKYKRAFRARRLHVVSRFPIVLSSSRYPDLKYAIWKLKEIIRPFRNRVFSASRQGSK